MAAIPDQGRAEGADGVGSEAGDVLPEDGGGRPAQPGHLVVARNALDRAEVKYFVSNAPAGTRLETLLKVAFSRWRVERCFEDEKTELGFDHYEGRNYTGLLRHQLVTAVSHLFLARVQRAERGENPDLTVCQVRTAMAAVVRGWGLGAVAAEVLRERAAEQIRWTQQQNAKARASHTKRTIRTLHAAGIRLADLKNCYRGSS